MQSSTPRGSGAKRDGQIKSLQLPASAVYSLLPSIKSNNVTLLEGSLSGRLTMCRARKAAIL